MAIRQTRHKQRVIDLLSASKVALSADELSDALGAVPNRVTVYRILERLENEGIAHRVVGVNNKSYYSLCDTCEQGHHAHHHAHFQCRTCSELTCLEFTTPLPRPPGFVVEDQQVLLIGLCAACSGQ